MDRANFKTWLTNRSLQTSTVDTKLGQCSTIEEYEGDLDKHYDKDRMSSLISKFQYSRNDERNNSCQKHGIPINGNIYNATASYRAALNLYFKFKESVSIAKLTANAAAKSSKAPHAWPAWESCSQDSIFNLAKDTVPYIKFLDPCIIEAIVKENLNHRKNIIDTLRTNGISKPEAYMWDGSPCAWPGIRRSVGNYEKKGVWKCDPNFNENINEKGTALYLDDNDMPKQIWAFTLTGTYFRKHGPAEYSLAHLIDHKRDNNRMNIEFSGVTDIPLYGLYSSAANAVFINEALMKPTDRNEDLRKLLFAKAIDLYKNVCNVVPQGMVLKAPSDPRFDIRNSDFKWSAPVGDLSNFDDFLEFRKQKYIDKGFPDMFG